MLLCDEIQEKTREKLRSLQAISDHTESNHRVITALTAFERIVKDYFILMEVPESSVLTALGIVGYPYKSVRTYYSYLLDEVNYQFTLYPDGNLGLHLTRPDFCHLLLAQNVPDEEIMERAKVSREYLELSKRYRET